jgi:hypothetical protein
MKTFRSPVLLATLALCTYAVDVDAFCGFYVAQADTKLFNKASKVVMVRDGDKTVLTMANDYEGSLKQFAIVVPVPQVIKKDMVRAGDKALLDRVDAWSAPRLVEYHGDNRWMRAAVVEGRLFSLGGKGDAPVLKELTAPPSTSPTSVTLVDVRNTVVNNSVHNEVHQHITTVNVKLEVLLKHVTNVVSLHSQSTMVVNNVDVDVLAPLASPSFVGVTDPDAGFFLRTAHQQKPMLQRAEGPDGNSYLVGRCVDGKAPAPKNATLVFTHPATQTSLQVRTDDRGQFAIPVTGLSGPAFVGLAGSGVAELSLD